MNIGVTCIMYHVERERENGGGEGTQILFRRGCVRSSLTKPILIFISHFGRKKIRIFNDFSRFRPIFRLQTLTILEKRTHVKLHFYRKRNPCLGILWWKNKPF